MVSAFDELIDLAKRLGITVRHARLGGTGGGLAKVRGAQQLFIDLDALPEDQLDQTVQAMSRVKDIDTVYVRPDVRKMIEAARKQAGEA